MLRRLNEYRQRLSSRSLLQRPLSTLSLKNTLEAEGLDNYVINHHSTEKTNYSN